MRLRSILFAPGDLRQKLIHQFHERDDLDQLSTLWRALNVIGSLPMIDWREGIYWPEKYLVVDTVICGSNPVLNAILLQACAKRGRSAVLMPTNTEDDWPYQLCDNPAIQSLIERACGFGRFDQVAETYNPGFEYKAPQRPWTDTFFGQIANGINRSGNDVLAHVPESFLMAVDPGTIDIGGAGHVLLHLSAPGPSKETVQADENKAEEVAEIDLPSYPEAVELLAHLAQDFNYHMKKVVPELPLVTIPNSAQMILAKQLLTTSRDSRFSRKSAYVGNEEDQTSAVEFDYAVNEILAFGSAAWASPHPDVAMERFTADILRAARYATSRMDEPDDAEDLLKESTDLSA